MNDLRIFTDLHEYLPTWYQDIKDYDAILTAEEQQIRLAASFMEMVHGNNFFADMTTQAVEMWEKILGVIPNIETESLEFRRARLINRISTKPPFTLRFLKGRLDDLIGPGAYSVEVDYNNYTLYVESMARNQLWASEVEFTINSIKPAHIIYTNKPLILDGILINETISKSELVYNYRLGSWGLGMAPFASQSDEEVFKMATTPSVQESYLNYLASAASAEDITAARINGNIVITNVTKTVEDNKAIISYPVTQAQAQDITMVELLGPNDEVFTRLQVYVPVGDSTIIKHTLTFEEGTNG